MSHQPERKEKNCLNCETTVRGRYCHVCGQENIVTKESFFSLLKHFVYDIVHFDSKFFDTLKYVLFRPGFIAKQYVEGKRARFLHPIRMYLFTSALFFLVFFSLKDPRTGYIDTKTSSAIITNEDRQELLANVREALSRSPEDSNLLKQLDRLQDTTLSLTRSDVEVRGNETIIGSGNKVSTVAQYDSLQRTLPAAERDGWLRKNFKRKIFDINTRYSNNPREALQHFLDLFLHKLPYLLFVSLPFFAFILQLLYARRRRFYYSDHAVFTLYHYIFSFILLMVVFLCDRLTAWTHLQLFQNLIPLFFLLWIVYLFIALRRFYGQGWGKTFSKFLLLNLLGFIVLLLLFVVFLFFTLFQL